jgi:hypothetical protein
VQGDIASTTIDLTNACRDPCRQAIRRVEFNAKARQITFTDHLLGSVGPVRWQAITDAKITLAGAVATLEKAGRRITLTCTDPALAWQAMDAAAATPAEKRNPGRRILCIEAPVTADLTLSIRVHAQ